MIILYGLLITGSLSGWFYRVSQALVFLTNGHNLEFTNYQ